MQRQNSKNYTIAVMAVLLIIFYFFNSAEISLYVQEAIYICYNTVIPSLFIFMVFTSYLSSVKGCEILALPFIPLFRLLNIHDKKIILYCVLSILSGFATGGYFLNRIKTEFNCNPNMLGVVSILVSCNSPAFVIVAVGANMFGNIYSGIILYCSVLLSCFITAFIFSFLFPYHTVHSVKTDITRHSDLSYSITDSVYAIVNICGVVIFSYSVCKVISLYIQNTAVSVAFSILSEVTSACRIIIDSYGKNLYLICAALAFCPVSTCIQLKSPIISRDFSLKILLLSKIIQIPLSLIILRVTVNLFPQSFAVYANSDIKVNMYWNSPHISCWLLISAVCFVICFDKEIGVFTKSSK